MVVADTQHRPPARESSSPLGIIAGGGSLPFAVADAAARQGRRVVLLALRDSADATRVSAYPHHWINFGQIGRCIKLARAERCREIVFIGGLVRPAISRLWTQFSTIHHLPQLIRLLRGGDDQMLTGFVRMLEAEGFRVSGAHEVAPEILMPSGPLGRHEPSAHDWSDIRRGLALLRATGPFDVGQAAVVAENRVLAIEGAEGTDEVLIRLAALRACGRVRWSAGRGVLVKALKSGQDRRIDMPSIGPRTVELAMRANMAGIAVTAAATVVAEADLIVDRADRAKIFVVGVDIDAVG